MGVIGFSPFKQKHHARTGGSRTNDKSSGRTIDYVAATADRDRAFKVIEEELAVGIEPKIRRRAIRRAAILMHKARGMKAAEEAASRALARRLRGDDAGFDVWSWISAAIRALDKS